MDDTFLVAMVLKGLPEEFKAFIAVVTQSEVHQIFQKFKAAIQNFGETKKTRNVIGGGNGKSDSKIIKPKIGNVDKSTKKLIECYTCEKKPFKSAWFKNRNKKRLLIVNFLHIQNIF